MSGTAGTTIAAAISDELLQSCRRWRIQATIAAVIPSACNTTNSTACSRIPSAAFAYGHSGGGAGFKTDVWVSGDGSRVAVLLLNGRSGDNGDLRAGAAMRDLYCKG